MQLARLRAFITEIQNDTAVRGLVNEVAAYHYYKSEWFCDASGKIDDETLLADLASTRERATHWRHTNDLIAYFPAPAFDLVVTATFSSASTKPTRNRFQAELDRCVERARNAFDATHDGLTGLLNGQAFADAVRSQLDSLDGKDEDATSAPASPTAVRAVALLALDVDHFKQVNDTYGHVYGDLVLKCLARRLEAVADTLRESEPDELHISVGRPSGEEFLVLVSGRVDTTRAKELAERFRHAVSKNPLPTDGDVDDQGAAAKVIPIPPIGEREVTVSVGVASASSLGGLPEDDSVRGLRNEADKALGSAKAGGRNRVRHFDDILSQYGTILEHDAETNVVSIDIGKEVRVRKGQEFFVFPGRFTGRVPFTYDDGRTRKTLGHYPRVSVGRIVVFDAQHDVSFCRITHKESTEPFQAGSHLEAIPLGSISHLIGESAFVSTVVGHQLATSAEIASTVNAAAEAGTTVRAVVLGVANEASLVETHGTAFLNQCLAHLYKAICETFPTQASVVQAQETRIGVVLLDRSEEDVLNWTDAVIKDAQSRCGEVAKFSAGVFLNHDTSRQKGDASELSPRDALSFAQFAAAQAIASDKSRSVFSPTVAASLVGASKQAGQLDRAIEDYEGLRRLGVKNASVENYAALATMMRKPPDYERAIAILDDAVALDPNDSTYRANLAFAHYQAGDTVQAHEHFQAAAQLTPDKTKLPAYLFWAAYAAFAAWKSNPAEVDRAHALSLVKVAQERAAETKRFSHHIEQLGRAHRELEQD